VLNFMIFNTIWSLLVLAYVGVVPLYATNLFHKLVSLALLAVTTIFWFAGSIALAVFTGVPECRGISTCGALQAAVAFGFFIWAIFTFLAVLDTLEALRSRGHATAAARRGGRATVCDVPVRASRRWRSGRLLDVEIYRACRLPRNCIGNCRKYPPFRTFFGYLAAVPAGLLIGSQWFLCRQDYGTQGCVVFAMNYG
jgi:hypothetical protein